MLRDRDRLSMKLRRKKNWLMREVLYFLMADYSSWKSLMTSASTKRRLSNEIALKIDDGR